MAFYILQEEIHFTGGDSTAVAIAIPLTHQQQLVLYCSRTGTPLHYAAHCNIQFIMKYSIDLPHELLEQSAMCTGIIQIVLKYVLVYHLMHESIINLPF